MPSRMELLREGFPDRPEMGPALSRVFLEQVAEGRRPPTIRLSRPGRAIAFGRRDVVAPGYRAAVDSAVRCRFPGIERISGGRAAVFTEGALSLTFTVPDPRPAERTSFRFTESAGLVQQAFRDLGVDARVGAVAHEYCPGEFSLNAGGRIKLAGAGQRMIRGAAHLGFVILVAGSQLAAEVLEPVYEALGMDFSPLTVGSLEDEVPGVTRHDVEQALLWRLGQVIELQPVEIDQATIGQAAARAADFCSPTISQ